MKESGGFIICWKKYLKGTDSDFISPYRKTRHNYGVIESNRKGTSKKWVYDKMYVYSGIHVYLNKPIFVLPKDVIIIPVICSLKDLIGAGCGEAAFTKVLAVKDLQKETTF